MAGGTSSPGESPAGYDMAADGRRTVGLLIPYTVGGRRVSGVTMAPCTFGHLLRWQDGRIRGGMALMMELTGLTLPEIEGLRQPDDGRVMDAFLSHVHPDIAADLREGRVPIMPAGDYGSGLADMAPPAAEAGETDIPGLHHGGTPFGGDLPDWAGIEAVGERPADYVPGIDD